MGCEREHQLGLAEPGGFDAKTGYGFSIEASKTHSPVEVLKLHGSTNWRALLFGGRTGFFAGGGNSLGARPVFFLRPDLEYLGYEIYRSAVPGTRHGREFAVNDNARAAEAVLFCDDVRAKNGRALGTTHGIAPRVPLVMPTS